MSIMYLYVLIVVVAVFNAVWIGYTIITTKSVQLALFYSNNQIKKNAVNFYIDRKGKFNNRINIKIKYTASANIIPILETTLYIRYSEFKFPKELNNLVRIIILKNRKFLEYVYEIDRDGCITTTNKFQKMIERKNQRGNFTEKDRSELYGRVRRAALTTMGEIFQLMLNTNFLQDSFSEISSDLPDSWQKLYYRSITVTFEKT